MKRFARTCRAAGLVGFIFVASACPETSEEPAESLGRAAGALEECRTFELVSSREYNPTGAHPDSEALNPPAVLVIPAEVEVINGNAGPSGAVNLHLYLNGVLNRCRYQSAQGGTKYVFDWCYVGGPGDLATADLVALDPPIAGLASAGTTTARVMLAEPVDDGDACTVDTCDPVTGVTHGGLTVDDGNPLTIEVCDPASGVQTWTAPAMAASQYLLKLGGGNQFTTQPSSIRQSAAA